MLDPAFVSELTRMHGCVDAALEDARPKPVGLPSPVFDAIADALRGGKRIRPILLCATAELAGGWIADVIDAACGIEMIHTASLIMDDLPCMDNATIRRGRLTTHRRFGQAHAVLASTSLLAHGISLITANAAAANIDVEPITRYIATAVGTNVVAGQAADLELRRRPVDVDTLRKIYADKTGELLALSATLGGTLCSASRADLDALDAYARDIGLAKQIVDDLLDCGAIQASAGKDVGKDAGRLTYVTAFGPRTAATHATQLFARARAHLRRFGDRAWFLRELADYVETVHGASPLDEADCADNMAIRHRCST